MICSIQIPNDKIKQRGETRSKAREDFLNMVCVLQHSVASALNVQDHPITAGSEITGVLEWACDFVGSSQTSSVRATRPPNVYVPKLNVVNT